MHTPRLKDKDKMPFGIHEGLLMEKVPPDYLLYIDRQPWITKWPAVKGYIDHNRTVLLKEIENPKQYG